MQSRAVRLALLIEPSPNARKMALRHDRNAEEFWSAAEAEDCMNVKTNQSMRDLLGEEAAHPEGVDVPVPTALVQTLCDGFKEIEGCIVPADYETNNIWSAERPRIDNRDDETGLECSLSKTHIEAFATDCTELLTMTRTAIAYGSCSKAPCSDPRTAARFA